MRPLLGLTALFLALVLWAAFRVPYAASDYRAILAASEAGTVEPVQPPAPADAPPQGEQSERPVLVAQNETPADLSQSNGRFLAASRDQITVARLGQPRPTSPSRASTSDRPQLSASGPGPVGLLPSAKPAPKRATPPPPPARTQAEAASDPAFVLASSAYSALAAGDRRRASEDFARALSLAPAHASANLWRRERQALEKRVFADAYVALREDAPARFASEQPVFGGSQGGLALRFDLDPLARGPVSLIARAAYAPSRRFTPASAEAAAGLAWRPLGRQGPAIALEHRFALEGAGRSDLQLRLSGGWASAPETPVDVSVYADAGVVGISERDLFAAGQAYAGYRVRNAISVGGGGWAGWQRDRFGDSDVVEAGPAARLRLPLGPTTLRAEASYRFSLGSDGPPDGPALTLSASY